MVVGAFAMWLLLWKFLLAHGGQRRIFFGSALPFCRIGFCAKPLKSRKKDAPPPALPRNLLALEVFAS